MKRMDRFAPIRFLLGNLKLWPRPRLPLVLGKMLAVLSYFLFTGVAMLVISVQIARRFGRDV